MLSGHKPDYWIIGVLFFLVLGGFFFLASASSDLAKIKYDDTYLFLKNQFLKGFLPGIVGFLMTYFIYYRRWKKIIPLVFFTSLILLAAVFTPLGYQSHGSFRWVEIGPISFQPSEILKITFILYLAVLLSSSQVRSLKGGWKTYGLFVFVSIIVGGLIFFQPATTTAVIILGAGVIVYFFSGASWKQILLTVLIGLLAIALLAFVTPYRFSRIAPYWNTIAQNISPSLVIKDVQPDSFHLEQSLIAIGTGGLWGVGFGKSTGKYNVLPEPMGDSIFAVIAEEFGFLGVSLVILAYLILFWRGTTLIKRSHDDFAKLCLLGFVSVISLQAIVHIAANSGLLPFTGVPLPLISYGGTSFAVTLTMMGMIANISRYTSMI
ncbi:MAG: stage V sporulation protein E [Candidatus Wolfebacteria bacterium GW2011_GWC1_43_10]|uniref:Probable peptidoglycan glycosyltransferase FtsW n=1 Tax=Candidatus Wolfebacteria bacterium GW2011_GWC1_43_10 TaxID=1619011 RepID=A0A0G1F6A4_9BACT|nr:MAG: stage V sporulation protein E [Candidatus Wolfebacteria bacterium GW2011_GWC1_43_10]